MLKKLFALTLAICVCLCAGLCAAEDDGAIQCEGIAGPYQWLNYELTVNSVKVAPGAGFFTGGARGTRTVKEDNRIMAQVQEPMLEICLMGGENGVAYADLAKENIMQFVLRDAAGQEIPLYCWSWWGIGYSEETGFGSFETQEGFALMYFMPDGVNAEELTLTVEPAAAE